MDFAMSMQQKISVAFILLFLLFMYVSYLEIRLRGKPQLRPLQGIERLRRVINRAIESGKPLHISIGSGSIGKQDTAETVAGLTVLEYMEQQGSYYRMPVITSLATPSALIAAYDSRRRAAGLKGIMPPGRVYFVAPQKIIYAAGASEIIKNEQALANVMIGPFGYEYLLLGEMTERQGIEQIGGTTDPRVLPYVYASSEHYLLGEEIFAAGAYLSGDQGWVASLMAQDRMRTLLSIVIVMGMILKSLGVI